MATVRLDNVSKRFGNVQAMNEITLAIESGEVLSLLGPSGCGKTTTLRSIAGLEQPSAGEIYIDRKPMQGVPIHKREVGMVFQDYALFPHLTVYDNIAFGLKMRQTSSAAIRSKIGEVLKLTRLAELPGIEGRYPHQLSGGQRQRVALARSLVTQPKVLLLDEPFGALDKKLRESMQVELRLLQRELNITMIFVTHDQEEALTLSDRIAVMHNGHVEQIGTPTEIYERPYSRFVADFIGVSNFFRGRVEAIEAGQIVVITDNHLRLWVPPADGKKVRVGDTCQIALRPEKISLSRHRPAAEQHVTAAVIKHIVYLGTVTHYYVKTEEGEDLVVYVQNQDNSPIHLPFAAGDTTVLSWKAESMLLLDQGIDVKDEGIC
jgi:spermidine/putrescine ABC transporter ATP-binding subunit